MNLKRHFMQIAEIKTKKYFEAKINQHENCQEESPHVNFPGEPNHRPGQATLESSQKGRIHSH